MRGLALARRVPPPAGAAEAAAAWRGYADPWTAWNHLRTGASLLAFALATAALLAASSDVQRRNCP